MKQSNNQEQQKRPEEQFPEIETKKSLKHYKNSCNKSPNFCDNKW